MTVQVETRYSDSLKRCLAVYEGLNEEKTPDKFTIIRLMDSLRQSILDSVGLMTAPVRFTPDLMTSFIESCVEFKVLPSHLSSEARRPSLATEVDELWEVSSLPNSHPGKKQDFDEAMKKVRDKATGDQV